jgi:hypothetical protein
VLGGFYENKKQKSTGGEYIGAFSFCSAISQYLQTGNKRGIVQKRSNDAKKEWRWDGRGAHVQRTAIITI